MDRNSIFGLLMIAAIMVGWMYWMTPSAEEREKQKRTQDSLHKVESVKAEEMKKALRKDSAAGVDTTNKITLISDTLTDSSRAELVQNMYGAFAATVKGEKKSMLIENELMKISISTLGGRIESVELKKYKTYDKKPLLLFHPDSSRFYLQFFSNNRPFSTDSLYFEPLGEEFKVSGDRKKEITFRLHAGSPEKHLDFIYGISGNSYLVNCKIVSSGLQDVIAANTSDYTLNWQMKSPSQEKALDNQRRNSTVYYKYDAEDPDYISETSDETLPMKGAIHWIAFKQQFFTSALFADSIFGSANAQLSTYSLTRSERYIKEFSTSLSVPYAHKPNESFGMKFYFGPNHYKTMRETNTEIERVIPLGWDFAIFGWVNRFIVIPIFNWLNSFDINFGIIILVLTLIIKVILFPIAYKTYLSSAKMRILKPEIEEINKKFGKEDPMKKQQAMMSLYKKAGVNPLAGCIPVLLQMPILIALFNFFPSSIELRQESFLWAEDLSTYDSIWTFGHVPLINSIYGDHVSLFTLLMTLSTLLYTYSNSQLMGSTEQMPGMKVMMYLMPVMFMGIFNNYSAGLSYYYFLANMITFGQTVMMRRFVDEAALHKKIQENKKKPVKVSGFQKKLEQMAKQRQQALKQKGKK